MFDWLNKRRAPSSETAKPVHCSFCNKSQTEVRRLVAGPSSVVCDECVVLCCSIMDERSGGHADEGRAHHYVTLLLDRLASPTDPEYAAAIEQAAFTLAMDDPRTLRHMARLASERTRHELAAEAFRRLGEDARDLDDDLEFVRALYQGSAYEEALDVLDGIEAEEDADESVLTMFRVAVQLRLSSNLDGLTLEQMRRDLDEAQPDLDDDWSSALETSRAEVLLRSGNAQGAMRLLRSLGDESLDALQVMLRGDAHLALGERSEALAWFRRAADEASTQGLREAAQARLGRASSDPYR